MKTVIVAGIFGFICSILLPKVGITIDSFEYWAIVLSGAAAIGLTV